MGYNATEKNFGFSVSDKLIQVQAVLKVKVLVISLQRYFSFNNPYQVSCKSELLDTFIHFLLAHLEIYGKMLWLM